MPNQALPAAGTHSISLEQAVAMTTRYRTWKETILMPEYRNTNLLCSAETIALADVQQLLSEAGAVAMRIYYGMDATKAVHAILVGVDQEGRDILPSGQTTEEGTILEEGQRCPPLCGEPSPLNP